MKLYLDDNSADPHLAALLRGAGEIYATDSDPERMADLHRRRRRAGAHNLFPLPMNDARELANLDAVLIDAPCSGTGTLRRRPDLLWKLNAGAIGAYAAQQQEILNRWAPAVRPVAMRPVYQPVPARPRASIRRPCQFRAGAWPRRLHGNQDHSGSVTPLGAVARGEVLD